MSQCQQPVLYTGTVTSAIFCGILTDPLKNYLVVCPTISPELNNKLAQEWILGGFDFLRDEASKKI